MPPLPEDAARHQWLLARLMAKSREQRFDSAQAALDAIAALPPAPLAEPVSSTAAIAL